MFCKKANGYPLSAIVGPRKIMKLMEDIFSPSTFGGEALSLAASIPLLLENEKTNLFKSIQENIEVIN